MFDQLSSYCKTYSLKVTLASSPTYAKRYFWGAHCGRFFSFLCRIVWTNNFQFLYLVEIFSHSANLLHLYQKCGSWQNSCETFEILKCYLLFYSDCRTLPSDCFHALWPRVFLGENAVWNWEFFYQI